MKIVAYPDIEARRFESGPAKGVRGRVLIGRADGAKNFCMRLFELETNGHTPCHRHDWEHEIFVHAGQGELWHEGQTTPVGPGYAVFIPGGTEHQIRNIGQEPLVFVCLVPPQAPEL